VILVHLQRNFNEQAQSSIPLFDNLWNQYVHYDIGSAPFTLSEDILEANSLMIMSNEKIVKFEKILSSLTEKCLLQLKFEGELS